jgi:thioredoxin reductase
MDDRHVDADVVVVGGGPAGAATAISCATRNLRVTLLERDVSGRERPGETLHLGASGPSQTEKPVKVGKKTAHRHLNVVTTSLRFGPSVLTQPRPIPELVRDEWGLRRSPKEHPRL